MYQPNGALLYLLFVLCQFQCQCRLNGGDNLEENHIEFYQNVYRKVLTTTPKPGRFSIFQKRTRPTFRRNNKHETLLTDYKIISTENDQKQIKRLNKSKASVEFVNIHDGSSTRKNINQASDSSNSSHVLRTNLGANLEKSSFNSTASQNGWPTRDSLENATMTQLSHIELTLSQQTVLAFEHGLKMKREAKCELPKATVVYLNQDREQIKIYTPRATILHRCGQNTGCCERESDRCVAIEQRQVNLYFFVIKMEKELNELDENYENGLKAVRKARKFASFDSNDDNSLKEYEYNLDYTLNGENENSFRLSEEESKMFNQFKSESSYLNTLLNEDNTMKRRLVRSTSGRRKSKDLNLDSSDSFDDDMLIKERYLSNISRSRRNLADDLNVAAAGESNATTSALSSRLNSKAPYNFAKSRSNRSQIRRSLAGQLRPRQTIEMLIFMNHTRCACLPASTA